MVGLADLFAANQIPIQLLDLDTENKARGSLTHFYGNRVPKLNIHTPAGLDGFVDYFTEGAPADRRIERQCRKLSRNSSFMPPPGCAETWRMRIGPPGI